MPLNYSEDKKILKFIRDQRQESLIQPPLYGSKFQKFTGKCENCDMKLNSIPVCVCKNMNPDLKYLQIKYLCSKCRSHNERFINFYIILKI